MIEIFSNSKERYGNDTKDKKKDDFIKIFINPSSLLSLNTEYLSCISNIAIRYLNILNFRDIMFFLYTCIHLHLILPSAKFLQHES